MNTEPMYKTLAIYAVHCLENLSVRSYTTCQNRINGVNAKNAFAMHFLETYVLKSVLCSEASCSSSAARVFDNMERSLSLPVDTRHSGQVEASIAPPHYRTIIDSRSGIGKGVTHLSGDERMSVLAVAETPSMICTNFASGENRRMG